jgi:FtsZ-binding cell division protein ZapB
MMIQSLPDQWLDIAASNASTKWLAQFIQTYLPLLQQNFLSADDFAHLFHAELATRHLSSPAQQKNYRSNLVQALKVLDSHHPAIALIQLSTETYRELNDVARNRLADRETKFFSSATAEWLVARAHTLLKSAEWSEVAAALAVLVGRRISELLLSQFSLKSEWSLSFSDMLKKNDDARPTVIEIPTLVPASEVLGAIERLQAKLQMDDLKLEAVSPKAAKQKVNSRFSEPVSAQCQHHFADLIPTRSDRDTLYTHIFRAVYATIAAHWFCPPSVPEHLFKAEIQGHFTLSKDGKKLPNYSARANYDDYAIGTEDGNRDGRLGIKLGVFPGLEVIEVFRKSSLSSLDENPKQAIAPPPQPDQTQTPTPTVTPKSTPMSSALPSSQLETAVVNAVLYRAVNLLLAKQPAELIVGLTLLTGLDIDVLLHGEIQPGDRSSISVDGTPVPCLTSPDQVIPAIQKLRKLKAQTKQIDSSLFQSICQRFSDIPEVSHLSSVDDLRSLYYTLRTTKHPDSTLQTSSEEKKGVESKEEGVEDVVKEAASDAVGKDGGATQKGAIAPTQQEDLNLTQLRTQDVARLTTLMLQQGIVGSPTELFAQLLHSFEQLQAELKIERGQLQQAISTIAWFTTEVNALKAQITQLESLHNTQDNQHNAQDLHGDAEAIALLQAEKDQLAHELHLTRSQLQAIQQLISGGVGNPEPISASVNSGEEKEQQKNEGAISPHPIHQHAIPPNSLNEETSTSQAKRPNPKTSKRNTSDTTHKINAIIDALIQWNTDHPSPTQQLRISIPPIKALASAMNANYQPTIQAVLLQRQAELDRLHQLWLLGIRHNASVKKKQSILQDIAKNYLHIQNYQEITF